MMKSTSHRKNKNIITDTHTNSHSCGLTFEADAVVAEPNTGVCLTGVGVQLTAAVVGLVIGATSGFIHIAAFEFANTRHLIPRIRNARPRIRTLDVGARVICKQTAPSFIVHRSIDLPSSLRPTLYLPSLH